MTVYFADAGMPCICDPGVHLVMLAHQHKLPVIPVPGPTALTTALAVSGMDSSRFVFEGFLPARKTERYSTINVCFSLSVFSF